MEINLTRLLDFPIKKPANDCGSKIDLNLTLALPYYTEVVHDTVSKSYISYLSNNTEPFSASTEKLANSSTTTKDALHENHGKRCSTCEKSNPTTWRKGPNGPKTLCNACGLRHLRNERRASEKRNMELILGTKIEERESSDFVNHSKRLRRKLESGFDFCHN